MKKKTDKEQELEWYRGRVKQLEESEHLIMKDRDRLLAENASLKHQLGGFMRSNAEYKKKVEHYKQLDKEGDELNERRIAEIDDLKDKLKEAERCVHGKERVIDGLNDQAMGLRETISAQEALIKDLRGDLTAYEANTEWFNALPWWKKMFTKL